jgi:eukaryotic-like serine/threonine-protein kinase
MTDLPRMKLSIDRILRGRYRIIKELGGGLSGFTYIAIDTDTPSQQKCVVKHLQPNATDDFTLQVIHRFFVKEAQFLEKLGEHPQIPRLLAYFEEEQEFYLVQEYIEGMDLAREVPPETEPLDEKKVTKLLTEILEVLVFVHERKIVHRDLKPSNIRRRKSDGKIFLIDFGAVKELKGIQATPEGDPFSTIVIGTHGYMPNEQTNGHPQLSSDIYAVGIIAIQALTGILPYYNSSKAQARTLSFDPQTGEIAWKNCLSTNINPHLAKILDRMVRYKYSERYPSAKEVLADLNNIKPKISLLTIGKNILFLGTTIAIIVSGLTFFSKLFPHKIDLKAYDSNKFNFKIQHPTNWKIQDNGNIVTKDVVTFIAPKQSDSDNFPEQITVNIQDFSGTATEFKQLVIKDIRENYNESKIILNESTSLANKSAERVIFTSKNDVAGLKNMQTWTLKNNKAYTIIYTADTEDYDRLLQVAETMIESFEIKE